MEEGKERDYFIGVGNRKKKLEIEMMQKELAKLEEKTRSPEPNKANSADAKSRAAD